MYINSGVSYLKKKHVPNSRAGGRVGETANAKFRTVRKGSGFHGCIFLKFYFIYLFTFGCVGSSLLRAAFSSCGERGLLFVVVRGLPIAVASLVAELGL